MLSWRAAGPIKGRKSWFYWSFVQLMDESGAVSWIESACFTRLSRIRRRSFPAPIWPPVRRITRSIAAAGEVCMCLYLHLLASPDEHWSLVWVHVTCQCSRLWQHKHPARTCRSPPLTPSRTNDMPYFLYAVLDDGSEKCLWPEAVVCRFHFLHCAKVNLNSFSHTETLWAQTSSGYVFHQMLHQSTAFKHDIIRRDRWNTIIRNKIRKH